MGDYKIVTITLLSLFLLAAIFSLGALKNMYEKSLAKNANLLIGLENFTRLNNELLETNSNLRMKAKEREHDYKKITSLQKENRDLISFKQKYEFMQSHKPKYNVGDKIGDYEIVKLDVSFKLIFKSFLNFLGNLLLPILGVDSADNSIENKDRFVYIIQEVYENDIPTHNKPQTVEESFLDEISAKKSKKKK